MDALLYQVITSPPQHRQPPVSSAQYTLLCAQTPTEVDRVQLLLTRLQSSTETSAAQNAAYLLCTCVTTATEGLCPDDAEMLVERMAAVALEHPDWADYITYVCALAHFYCTDAMTISIFYEFEVPKVAVAAMRDFPSNATLALASSELLSHFNFFDIDDGVTQLTHLLLAHRGERALVQSATKALAEFTSFYKDIADLFPVVNKEFVAAGGLQAVQDAFHDFLDDEEIATFAARITANVTSSGEEEDSLPADSPILMYLAEALARYQQSERMCSHVLRVFSSVPRSPHIDWDCVTSLFHNTRSELVVLECVHFFSSVAIHVKELKPKIFSTGCVARVLDRMRYYKDNAAIQEVSCSLLSYLSFDSEAITSSITESRGIEAVLAAMRRFPEDEGLLMAACASLSGLTFNNLAGQRVIEENGGVQLILDAMRHGTRARLQENGCLAIGTMCWNTALKNEVVRLGGVEVIMRALEEHYTSSGLVKNACRALAQVAFNCDEYRDEMSARGVIPLIIRGMEQHPNYDRAQMHGCVALSYLSWTNEGNAAQITSHSGYRVVVDAMRNHPNNSEVQEHACRALANISNVGLRDAGLALEQITLAMLRHPTVSEVQEEACRAIVTLALASPVNKDRLFELDGAEAVVAAMRQFPHRQLVQQETCNALAHLAYEHADLNRRVTELEGVSLLLTAMRLHANCPKVQLNACGGLSALAFDNTVAQRQIYELGGVACVIHAMEHFERVRMLELGCSVLGTLAWNTDIKERVAQEAIPEILKAMRVHEANPLLQKSTCRAISQFAFNSEMNRQLLADLGAIPLIVRAMRQHVNTEKLIVHALKALTYLCWENTAVAETIIAEDVESVLQRIVEVYSHLPRVYNEAVHLSKILFRKTSGTSPSPSIRIVSPPMASPQSIAQTPAAPPLRGPGGGPRHEETPMAAPSPPMRDTADLFHPMPGELTPRGGGRARGGGRGGPRGGGRGGGYPGRGGYVDPERRFARPPRGGVYHHHHHGPTPGGGGHRAEEEDGLWDDPAPGVLFRGRGPAALNWQQAELTGDTGAGGGGGGRAFARGGGGRGGGSGAYGQQQQQQQQSLHNVQGGGGGGGNNMSGGAGASTGY